MSDLGPLPKGFRPYRGKVLLRRDDEAHRRHVGALAVIPPETALKRGMRTTYIAEDGTERIDPLGLVFARVSLIGEGHEGQDFRKGDVACFTPAHSTQKFAGGYWLTDASEVHFLIREEIPE
jgi:hypothetical protein